MCGILGVLHDKLAILSKHWPWVSKLRLASPNLPAGSEFTMVSVTLFFPFFFKNPTVVCPLFLTEAGPNDVKSQLGYSEHNEPKKKKKK